MRKKVSLRGVGVCVCERKTEPSYRRVEVCKIPESVLCLPPHTHTGDSPVPATPSNYISSSDGERPEGMGPFPGGKGNPTEDNWGITVSSIGLYIDD